MKKYRFEKIIKIIFAAVIITVSAVSVLSPSLYALSVNAESDVAGKTGRVKPGEYNVRIRTAPDTSDNSNVITKVSDGFTFTILDKVYTSDTYYWYKIEFYYDNSVKTGYITGEYTEVVNDGDEDYDPDGDFEAYLDKQGFPEDYRESLRALHKKYPEWIFVADHTGYDWEVVLENEMKTGRSLIPGSSISSWKSMQESCFDWESCEWFTWDSGSWVQASGEMIEYAMDPRNFLNESNIFMFENLSYNSSIHKESGVNNVISGSFMENLDHDLNYNGKKYSYASGLVYAGSISGVSPFHLATRIIQEQGYNGKGASISGTVDGYEGYYNYYNQGAVKSGDISATVNGMIYASKEDSATYRPWNSRMKSIIGGSVYIGSKYINRGQYTIYYQKFDLVSPYWHQYMTNILAPRSESVTASKAYSDETKKNTSLTFTIPVYDNMPESRCEAPTKDGCPNNKLSSLSVENYSITPSFDMDTTEYSIIVESDVTKININVAAICGDAQITGDGERNLDLGENVIEIEVAAENGDVRTYTLRAERKPGGITETGYMKTDYDIDENNKYISGIGVGNAAADILSDITLLNGASAKITDADGKEYKGIAGTGKQLRIYDSKNKLVETYTIVIYGDCNGDGYIDLFDIVVTKNHVLDKKKLSGVYFTGGDSNKDGKVDLFDIVMVKNHILGKKYIKQ